MASAPCPDCGGETETKQEVRGGTWLAMWFCPACDKQDVRRDVWISPGRQVVIGPVVDTDELDAGLMREYV